MSKKFLIIALVSFPLILAIGGAVWHGKRLQKEQKNDISPVSSIQRQAPEQDKQQHVQGAKFVTDIDPNVDHWQMKETEFFTIRFPKEWYWMRETLVITNNPNFDTNKYSDIGFSMGGDYPTVVENNTEVVMTVWGTPTSNSGTPKDALDYMFGRVRENNPSSTCKILNDTKIPFTAYCVSSAVNSSEKFQFYYIINEKISLAVIFRTTQDTQVKKDTLDTIVDGIVLKEIF